MEHISTSTISTIHEEVDYSQFEYPVISTPSLNGYNTDMFYQYTGGATVIPPKGYTGSFDEELPSEVEHKLPRRL